MKIIKLTDMANRIKARRIEMGFTQEKFCEVADISVSTYTKIENAFQTPSFDALIAIAQHLEMSLDYMVFGAQERAPKEVTNLDIINALIESADGDELSRVGELLMKIARAKK